jgi:hypothetical protein
MAGGSGEAEGEVIESVLKEDVLGLVVVAPYGQEQDLSLLSREERAFHRLFNS